MAMNNMEKNARGDKAARGEEKTVDVFFCYKETDKETEAGAAEGIDVLALNEQLAGAGYRVLFSRITLADKSEAGQEPVCGVLDKEGWDRLLRLMDGGEGKTLAACEMRRESEAVFVEPADVQAQALLSVGSTHTVGLKADGTVLAVGNHASGQCDVSGWEKIVAVSAGKNHTVGLRADGKVLATGYTGNQEAYRGQCEVSGWTDVAAVSAGLQHTVGLKTDGTVEAAGANAFGECAVSGWTEIAAISAGAWHTVGLKTDGTVISTQLPAEQKLNSGQCAVSEWKEITAISAGTGHTVGLRADGTVAATVFTGDQKHNFGQCQVSGWKGIIAVSAGAYHTVGLKADGTVVAVGRNINGQCEVSDWSDIVAVSAGEYHTVGLKADGTLVTAGSMAYGCGNVTGWRLFRSFETVNQERKEAFARQDRERLEAEEAERERLVIEQRRREAIELRRQELPQRINALRQKLQADQEELANLKGLLSGIRREELASEISKVTIYIKNLQKRLAELERN